MLVLEVDVTTVGVGDKFVLTMSANVLPCPCLTMPFVFFIQVVGKEEKKKTGKGFFFRRVEIVCLTFKHPQ